MPSPLEMQLAGRMTPLAPRDSPHWVCDYYRLSQCDLFPVVVYQQLLLLENTAKQSTNTINMATAVGITVPKMLVCTMLPLQCFRH